MYVDYIRHAWGVYILGGICPRGMCPRGKCPEGKLPGRISPWAKCPEGTCPGEGGGVVLSPYCYCKTCTERNFRIFIKGHICIVKMNFGDSAQQLLSWKVIYCRMSLDPIPSE